MGRTKRVRVIADCEIHELDNGWHDVEELIRNAMREDFVVVGIRGEGRSGPTNAQKAVWNEFGVGGVPKRPFLLPAFDENVESMAAAFMWELNRGVRKGEPSVSDALLAAAQVLYDEIAHPIDANIITPRNARLTILLKGFDHPLVEHGDMRRGLFVEAKKKSARRSRAGEGAVRSPTARSTRKRRSRAVAKVRANKSRNAAGLKAFIRKNGRYAQDDANAMMAPKKSSSKKSTRTRFKAVGRKTHRTAPYLSV